MRRRRREAHRAAKRGVRTAGRCPWPGRLCGRSEFEAVALPALKLITAAAERRVASQERFRRAARAARAAQRVSE